MAHDSLSLFGDIEDAIIQRLRSRVTGTIQEFNLTDNVDMVRCPAVNVAMHQGANQPVSAGSVDIRAEFNVTVVVANPRDSQARRRELYPLLSGIILALSFWKPTLTEDDSVVELAAAKLRVGSFRNVLESDSRIAFTVKVETVCGVDIPEDEEGLATLLEIGLNYMIKPGDDIADARDEIAFEPDEEEQ